MWLCRLTGKGRESAAGKRASSSRVTKVQGDRCLLIEAAMEQLVLRGILDVWLNSSACFADACWYRASKDANCLVAVGQKGQRVA
jgi:hypothetical protein